MNVVDRAEQTMRDIWQPGRPPTPAFIAHVLQDAGLLVTDDEFAVRDFVANLEPITEAEVDGVRVAAETQRELVDAAIEAVRHGMVPLFGSGAAARDRLHAAVRAYQSVRAS